MGEGVGWGERGWGREGVSAPAPDSLPACFFDSLLTGYRLVQTALDIICLSVSFCYDKIGKLNLKNMNRRRKLLKKLCAASAGSITRQFGADSLRRNVSFRISLRGRQFTLSTHGQLIKPNYLMEKHAMMAFLHQHE